MSTRSPIGVIIAAAMLLGACGLVAPRYFGEQLAWIPGGPDPNAINSVAFAKREPAPGQPGYLETIRYIDSGVKYVDPQAEFFISFDGQMCFRGVVNQLRAGNYQNYWCMPPIAVNNIDAIENDVSYVNEVRLWCRHAAPQCARKFGFANFFDETGWVANSISSQIIPYKQQRAAIEYLIYLMGGDVRSRPGVVSRP